MGALEEIQDAEVESELGEYSQTPQGVSTGTHDSPSATQAPSAHATRGHQAPPGRVESRRVCGGWPVRFLFLLLKSLNGSSVVRVTGCSGSLLMPSKGFLISVSNPFLLKTGSYTLPTVNTRRSEFGWRGTSRRLPMAAKPSQAWPALQQRTAQCPPGGPEPRWMGLGHRPQHR